MASISRLLSSMAPAFAFSAPASPSPRGRTTARLSSTTPPPPPPCFLHSASSDGASLHAPTVFGPFGSPRHLRPPPLACASPKRFGGYQLERIKGIRKKNPASRNHKEHRMLWSWWDMVYPRSAEGEGKPGELIPPEFDVPPRRGEGELPGIVEDKIEQILKKPFSEWTFDNMDYMERITYNLKEQRATGIPGWACKFIPE